MNDPRSAIRKFIQEKFLGKPLSDDQQTLFTSGIIDSFGVLELIAFLEREFKIYIDTQRHELAEFDSIDSILRVVDHVKGATR